MTAQTEPVRRNLYVVGVFVILGSLFTALGLAESLTFQTVATVVGAALAEGAALVAGVERARDKVYSPATANEIMDAESVIRQAEGDA